MSKNRENLSDEDLRKKMNYDQFIQEYKPTPFYKSKKFYLTLVALGAIFIGGYILLYEESGPGASGKQPLAAFIHPPLQGVDVLDSIYEIDPASDTVIGYLNGSSIHIPAQAFLDKQGKTVKGIVQLHYREFHDAVDFFLSGIPMTYDSAGKIFCFKSAGMLDISAFQYENQVFTNPAAPITVKLSSDVTEGRFNIYYLDTAQKKWEYINQDFVRPLMGDGQPAEAFSPFKTPIKASGIQPKFAIVFDKKQFPELATYDGVSFEVTADEKYYDPKLAMKEWDQVKLARHPDGIHYLVTFMNPGEEHVFKVQPVFSGVDYTRAMLLYDGKMKNYESMLAKNKEIADQKKRKLDSADASRNKKMRSVNSGMKTDMRFDADKETTSSLIFRLFTISRFGIWNSDCPKSLPQGKIISARFMDAKANPLEFDHVYLVEKGRKLMYSYYPDQFDKFSYNPASTNLLWAVTKDGKLAVFGPEEFEKIKADKDSSNFTMKLLERKISSVFEVKVLLGI